MLRKQFDAETVCEVTFEYETSQAKKIALVVEANDWQPITMQQNKGRFVANLSLPLDRQIQFRYLLDGQTWANDPMADAYVPNEFGSANSVVDTTLPVTRTG